MFSLFVVIRAGSFLRQAVHSLYLWHSCVLLVKCPQKSCLVLLKFSFFYDVIGSKTFVQMMICLSTFVKWYTWPIVRSVLTLTVHSWQGDKLRLDLLQENKALDRQLLIGRDRPVVFSAWLDGAPFDHQSFDSYSLRQEKTLNAILTN